MSASKSIEETLHEFVASQLLDGDADHLTPTTNLLALGVIDSLSMVSIRVFIERSFNVRVPNAIQPEEMASVSAMAAMIERLQRDVSANA
jgi:acyl carrier protein